MNKTTYFTLLLLTPALLCFAQESTPSEPRSDSLMAFGRAIEAATAQADVAFVARALADDFAFTHGDAWRTGGKPSRVDTKKSWLDSVARGMFVSRELHAQQVEPHGSMFITTGRIDVKLKAPFLNAGKPAYCVASNRSAWAANIRLQPTAACGIMRPLRLKRQRRADETNDEELTRRFWRHGSGHRGGHGNWS